MECVEHKVKQVRVPWEEEWSRFTALFEGLILDWLQQASIAAVAGMMGLIKHVARMVRKHLEGILTTVVERVTDVRAEGINSSIQWLSTVPVASRNRQRFRDAVYFHFGGLDVHPQGRPSITSYPHEFLKRL